jgi:hypothetical protein
VIYALQIHNNDNERRVHEIARDLRSNHPCLVIGTAGHNLDIPPLDSAARAAWKPDLAVTYSNYDEIIDAITSGYQFERRVGQHDQYEIWVPRKSPASG